MDRKEFWYGQVVDDDGAQNGLNVALDDVENGLDNNVVDRGRWGKYDGLLPTQHSPTADMTVDVSSGVAYDKDGKRCNVPASQNVDFSGVTLPAAGKEKWVSLQLAHDIVQSDPWIDDLAVPGYWSHADSFEFVLVEGVEATPPATKPALHASNILICDVKLVNAQTQILNADIDTDRCECAVINSGGEITRDLTPAQDDYYALGTASRYFTTAYIKTLNITELGNDLLPSVDNTYDLGSASKRWAELHSVSTVDTKLNGTTTTLATDLVPETDGT